LEGNDYQVTKVPIEEGLETLKSLTKTPIRTIPQVTIEGEYVGGFGEVEERLIDLKFKMNQPISLSMMENQNNDD
jgi:glutaredoxin-related protein